jgi:apolipoprotein N-acyltransferase
MPPFPANRAAPIAFALGVTAACGFAPLEYWPLTLLCLAGLTLLLDQSQDMRRAICLGWWFGLGNFCLGLNWIATAFTYQAAMPAWLGWVAVFLLSLYLAIFPAFATGLAWRFSRDKPLSLPFFFAAAWTASELLRASLFTGFAWNPLAAIWAPVWPIRWLTAYVGTYGLSGLTILFAGLLWLALTSRKAQFVLGGVLGLGIASAFIPHLSVTMPANTPLLRVVQPNIGQDRKWDEAQSADNYHRLKSLSGQPEQRRRLLLWPEVAVPALLEQDPLARQVIASLLGPHDEMLLGAQAVRFDAQGNPLSASNSTFGLDPHAHLFGRYDKAHLVPYGEYLPMRPVLSRLGLSRLAPGDMDFDAGPGPRDIIVPGLGKVGIQICYEIIFSGHVVDRANRPLFIFNPSNDAWFGRWGPPQHLAQARLRATEEGLPVVRSTPTGISAVIDADGQVLASLPWRTPGAIERPLPPAYAPTLFARYGNILPWLLVLFLGAIGFASRRRAS